MRKLLIERYNQAGTDDPYYYDEGTGFEISGYYEDDDAFPFGYFPVDPYSNRLEFFCGDRDFEETVHNDLFNIAISTYASAYLSKELGDVEDELFEFFTEIKSIIDKENLEYSRREDDFVNLDGDFELDFPTRLKEEFKKLDVEIPVTSNLVELIVTILRNNDWDTNYSFSEELWNYATEWSDDAEEAARVVGINTEEVLQKARLVGRMWIDRHLITFYPGQQPSGSEMEYVVKDLAEYVKYYADLSYEDILNFYTIFETNSKKEYTGTGYKIHDDAKIECCTIRDYIAGKYKGFNREDEVEMVKNRKGVGSLNVHLANQDKKREFFKDFRDTRDKVVFVPREKGAGSLAAYHAMRYPFSENTIKESGKFPSDIVSALNLYAKEHPSAASSVNNILDNQSNANISSYGGYEDSYDGEAGTDNPCFYDPKTGTEYTAYWQDGGAFPFGFWPSMYKDNPDYFSIGDESYNHANACGKAAKVYIKNILMSDTESDSYEIQDSIEDLLNDFKEHGYRLSDDEETYYSVDENGEIDDEYSINDWLDILSGRLYVPKDFIFNVIKDILISSIKNGKAIQSYEIIKTYDEYLTNELNKYNIGLDGSDIDYLFDSFNVNGSFDDYFSYGNLEGRIWTNSEMMGFYEEQQPTAKELDEIVRRLDESDEIPAKYEDIMNYMIIYYADEYDEYGYHNNVTGCTVYEYIHGAPMDDKINPDERKGVQFIPHLANQQQKREFFKDFRDARDRAIYYPREKAAGNLAAYHAMRYPFGESKKTGKKVYINESDIKLLFDKEIRNGG